MATSERWKKLRDAAARASWVVYDAKRDLERTPADSQDIYSAESVLRSARTLRALALWEMRRQGRIDAQEK